MREPGTLENGVLFGRDGHLFLAEGGHQVLDFISGRRQVPHQSLCNFQQNVLARRGFLNGRGIGYLHCISPDKQSVIPECFPAPQTLILGELYTNFDMSLRDSVLYPRELLRGATAPTFMRTDTHMTDHGTLTSVAAIVQRLTGQPQGATLRTMLQRITVARDWVGDLGGRFAPPLSEIRYLAEHNGDMVWFHNNLDGGNNGIVDILFNRSPVYHKNILIFGDSFGREYTRFLGWYFRQSVFLRTPFFHEELIEQIKPDYVLTQNVERYLDFCQPDEVRPSFFMYPHLAGNPYRPAPEFAEAFSAVLSGGRAPYRSFLEKIGVP